MTGSVRLIKSKVTAKSEIVYERKELKAVSSIHWHDFCEVDMILSGEGISNVNGKQYECRKGMVVFMSPSDVHDYQANHLEIFNVQFCTEGVDSQIIHTLMQLKGRVAYVKTEDWESFLDICRLLENTRLNDTYRALYDKKMLESILLMFLQNMEEEENEEKHSDVELIQKIVVYINAHFAENPMLRDVAKEFHLNENYLCSLFRQHMGEKYKAYLRKIKLEHAEKLICLTDLPMTEIAFSCGYITQSHFNREFRSFFQVTPKQMREKEKAHIL